MTDDFLDQFRKAPRPDFETALYKRISKPMETQTKYRVMRALALPALILAILIASVLFIPAARTFAQEVLQKIGAYGFIQGTPEYDAGRVPGPITIVRDQNGVTIQITGSGVTEVSGPAEASSLAGFTALSPSYLPAGYTAFGDQWLVMAEGSGNVVMNGYHDDSKNFFMINQWKAGEGDLKTYKRETIVDVTVRGQPGVWLPDPAAPEGKNALVWLENGITYSIIGNALTLDEMMKVAESLGS